MDLSGKWTYEEDYGCGRTRGVLFLQQEGELLEGRIVFTDCLDGEEPYMVQEFLKGSVEGRKVRLFARSFDFIEVDGEFSYELDKWFGLLLDERTIRGISLDEQGIEGKFQFLKQ